MPIELGRTHRSVAVINSRRRSLLLPRKFSSNLNIPNVPLDKPKLTYQVAAIDGAYVFVLLLVGVGVLLTNRHARRRLLRFTIQTREQRRFTGDGQVDLERASLPRFDPGRDQPNAFVFPPSVKHSRVLSKSDLTTAGSVASSRFSHDHISIDVSPIDADPVVRADRAAMAHNLEDIYAHVLAQEDAKTRGVDVRSLPTMAPGDSPLTSPHWSPQTIASTSSFGGGKMRKKPQKLHFDEGFAPRYGKSAASRTATFMSALRSPIKTLRTPRTANFYRGPAPEEEPLTPRHYISGPLMPSESESGESSVSLHVQPREQQQQNIHHHSRMVSNPSIAEALAPSREASPETAFPPTHIGEPLPPTSTAGHGKATDRPMQIDTSPRQPARRPSDTITLRNRRLTPPMSPQTTMSTSPLSPVLPGVQTVPSAANPAYHYLPGSSQAQGYANHHRPSPSTASASTTHGHGQLPFRQYEQSPISPASSVSTAVYPPQTATKTKTTILERTSLLPSAPPTAGLRSPWTNGATPYSPYMPQTPIVPVTPRLVTREERRERKRQVPRTPVVEMVGGEGEVWGDGYA